MRIYYFGELIADTQNKQENSEKPKKKKIKVIVNDVSADETQNAKPQFIIRNFANA